MTDLILAVSLAGAGVSVGPEDAPEALDWVTVGDPGNRDTIPEEVPVSPDWEIGGVGYAYRIMRTEVTVGQWVEFVNAYAPFHEGDPMDYGFVGVWIEQTDEGYEVVPGKADHPQHMDWYMAARYCNWLHNGKVAEARAFEDGAYDASAFGEQKDGVWGGPETRRDGARVWIPSEDEWVKAMHYDPDRYGPGVGGYWINPDGGDGQLVSGYPEDGGETTGGLEITDYPVGQYPHVVSPWGAMDGSGGRREWNEDIWLNGERVRRGSWVGSGAWHVDDRIDVISSYPPDSWYQAGVRLATWTECEADVNGDEVVDVLDALTFLRLFREGETGGDFNDDGAWNVLDFVAFQVAFRAGCR